MTPTKKPRKPRALDNEQNRDGWTMDQRFVMAHFSEKGAIFVNCRTNAKQARRLAKWLVQAAEYLESKKEKRG